jgi:AraC-like DNA-binding protein
MNLAEQMIAPPDQPEALLRLYLESRALELVAEAFSRQEERPAAQSDLSARAFKKLCELREWLDSGSAEGLALTDIARYAGCNTHSLQAQFRAAFGCTVFDYLRTRKLQTARIALETQGVSVSQAAFLAGYSSSANFATAFRRCFGITPRQVRRTQ